MEPEKKNIDESEIKIDIESQVKQACKDKSSDINEESSVSNKFSDWFWMGNHQTFKDVVYKKSFVKNELTIKVVRVLFLGIMLAVIVLMFYCAAIKNKQGRVIEMVSNLRYFTIWGLLIMLSCVIT